VGFSQKIYLNLGINGVVISIHAVSFHAPATPETKQMINKETLAMMKDGAYLINTSRGALINEKAFVEVLKEGKLGGVELDERQINKRLLSAFDNVLITPHISWYSTNSIT